MTLPISRHQLMLANHLFQYVVYQFVVLLHPSQMLLGRDVNRP